VQVPSGRYQIPEQSRRKQPRIAFFGHFGKGNLGNDSTLRAILYNLRRLAPDAEFRCICSGPETVASAYHIAAVPSRDYVVKPWTIRNPLVRLARKFLLGIPSELYRWLDSVFALRGTDALIIPGTGLLTDVSTLLNWGPYDMFRWSLAARLCRCKLFFVSVGAGPIYSRAGRFFVKAALSLANFRSYRDESTLQYLKGVGHHAQNDRVYPDLAFSLPETVIPQRHLGKGRRLVVGLGLMEDARKYNVEMLASFTHAAYLESLVEFASWLLAHGHDVRLLIGSAEDTPVTQEFKSLLKTRSVKYEEERIIDAPAASGEDLLSQLAATDLVVATRFHNVLFSLLLNKPVIALSFHHKCSSLMSQMGLSEYSQDINSLNASRLIAQFCQLQQNADFVKRIIMEKVAACRNALDEQYGIIFKEICPERQQTLAHAVEMQHNRNSSVLE
jgi:polysaccharide pyruvyl transferase WcaK-like protein